VARHDFVSLQLNGTSADPVPIYRGMLDGSLTVARDLIVVEQEPGALDVADRFDVCRNALTAEAPIADIVTTGDACLRAARGFLEQRQARQAAKAQELSALVRAVREVVASVGTDMSSLHTGLEESAGRFDAIGQLSDIAQLKAQLLREIATLKEVTATRRHAWEETSRRLHDRILTLEQELVTSRAEASTDPLTQIANRRAFERACQNWLATPSASFVIAVLDVDDLKTLNDAFGHEAGDRALQFVAQTLSRSLRAGDVVARLGGDEFAMLVPHLTLDRAEHRFKTIVGAISDPGHAITARPPHVAAVSCGLAEFSAGDTMTTLLKRADAALYDAKRLGRNRIVARRPPLIRDIR
jgi:diguanylate cyclase